MMFTKKQNLKCIAYKFFEIILALHILVFWNVAKGDLENITARDILQKNLETISSKPPMMADGEVIGKWNNEGGISEEKFISRIYVNNEQYDTTRETWKLEDGKWTKSYENRGIWDGSRYTSRARRMEYYTESGFRVPADFLVILRDKPRTIEWGMWAFGLGVTTGDDHFAKPMLESKTLRLRPEMEQVDGYECYVLEGNTHDYHYTVWIDPNNGYLHRKIIGEGRNFEEPEEIQNGPELVKYGLEVTGAKIESIDGVPMVTEAKRSVFGEYADGSTTGATTHEKIFNIVWNPDFEKESAFKLDNVPNGTRVAYFANGLNKTGVKFHWQDGKIVANIDEEVIEQIDKMTEEILAEDRASNSLETTRKTEITTNEPAITKETQPEIQVDTAKGRGEVISETRPFYTLLLIPIGLLIIGIISWKIYIIKGRKS